MALSDGLGIQALVQSYDKKAISQAFTEIASQLNKSVDDLNDDLNKIKIDKDVVNNLVNQLKALPEEIRKKTQGMSFDLFSDLINADGAEEKIDKAIETFSNKMKSFVKLRDSIGNDKIIIETDLSDLDELIKKEEKILLLETQIQGLRQQTKKYRIGNDQIKSIEDEINAWVQNRQQVDKYNVEIDEVKKNITELAKSNRNINWSNIDNKNVDTIKEMVGWLERYVQLTGDISGLKELNIPGVIDLRKLFSGDITSVDPNLTQQVKDFQDMVKRYSGNFNTDVNIQSSRSIDTQKLKEQEQEINKIRESLTKTESRLEQVNQKYAEQSGLVSELENKLKALEDISNPKVIETDEYKNIISELETAKNKASEFQAELDETKQTVEALKNSLSSYNTGDVVPRQDFENANRVINNLTSIIKELETSLTETEGKFASLSSEVIKLQQDKSALDEQLAQQKEINAGQQEQISNSQKIKIELDEIKKKYQDLKNSIKEMEDAQSRYMALLDKFDQAEAFNEAIQNVHYNEGKNTPEGFINFDYLDKAKQKLQETGNAYEKATKAAVYYYQYLQKGGTEKIFNQDGKDISDELISLYKEMSSLANDKTGLISYESINKTVREYANELRLAKEELSSEKELISQKNKELKETLSLEKNIAKTKQEVQKTEEQTKDTTAKSSGKRTMSRKEFIAFTTARQKEQQVNQEDSSNISQPLQTDSSSIVSEQQALKKLEQAINSVTIAIAQKNKAIQAEEVQMDSSVNSEIKKLEELKGKLNEIKTQFENGIASGLFKDTDNENADGNYVNVDLKPTVDTNKFKEDAERLLTFVDVEKEVNLKVGELDASNIVDNSIFDATVPGKVTLSPELSEAFKSDADESLDDVKIEKEVDLKIGELNGNNQNVENIKEQIESVAENIDLNDSYNPNQFDELLSKDFSTKGKKEATSQLREAYNEFKQYYNDLNELNTVEGKKAAYNYYKSYEEAINQNISKTNLERYTVANGIYNNEDLNYEIDLATRSMKLFSEVQNELGNIKIDDSIAEHVSKLAYNFREFEKVKSDLDNNVPRLESVDEVDGNLKSTYSMEATKKEYEELSDTVTYFETILKSEISYAKEFGETFTQSAQKAESAIAEVNDELNKPQQLQQQPQFKPIESDTGNGQEEKKLDVITVPVEPILIQSEWEAEIDRILEAIGTKQIKIVPDTTSQEWNDFKSYIEEISNLTIHLTTDNDDKQNADNNKKTYSKNTNSNSGSSSTTTPKPVTQNIPSAPDPSVIIPIENLSEEWENARRAAQLYDDELSDIVNVTKQIRTNEKTGERLISYRVSDDQGKQVTVGKNWNLISYTDQIADQAKAAKEQQKQQEKLLKEQQEKQKKLYKDLQNQSNEKQRQTEKTNIAESNALLEKQFSLFREIHTVQSEILQLQRTETSTPEDAERLTKEIDSLKEKKKLLQEEYVQNNKNLQQYDSYVDKADQLSKLQNISNTFSTKNSADAYKELNAVFKEYENIQNRIAKNEIKGIDNQDVGLLDEREKILTRIANIQNQIKTEGLTNTASDIDFSNHNKELERNIELMKAQADAEREAREANKSSRSGLGTSNENLKNVIDLYDRLLTNMQQIKQLQDAQSTRTLSNDEEQYLVKLQDQKIDLEQKYNAELEKGYVQTSKIKEVVEETNKLLAKDTNDVDLNSKTFSGRETNIDTAYDEAQKVNSALNRTSALMDELSHKDIANFEKPFDNASIKISLLNQRLASGSINLATYDNSVNRVVSSLRNIVEVLDDTATTTSGIEAMQRHLSELSGGNFTIIDTKTVGTVTTLTAEFEDQDKVIQRVRMSYNDLNKQVAKLGTTGKQSISSFSKFIDELGAKFRNLSTYLLSFVGFYEVWGAIQQGVTYVRELDSALTEMKKVSDETTESLKAFQEESFDIADSVASTAKEIQNSTADWLRLGYAMDEASELARTTAVYKAVGDDMDIATATESMVSTLQGFQLEADQAANIVDQFNEVSNNFAIDSKGIGDALQRSAASFNAANTGMSEAIALITATNAVLQDPEKVGM